MRKQTNTRVKTFLDDDVSKLHELLERLGFEVNSTCIHGTFYETWKHTKTNITFNASYNRLKNKRRRFFTWRGNWDNFNLNLRADITHIPYAKDVELKLLREIVAYIGGRMEIKTLLSAYHTEIVQVIPIVKPSTQRIEKLLQDIIEQKTLQIQESEGVQHA